LLANERSGPHPNRLRSLAFPDDGHGTRRAEHDLLGHTAVEDLLESLTTLGTHDHEVEHARLPDDLVHGIAHTDLGGGLDALDGTLLRYGLHKGFRVIVVALHGEYRELPFDALHRFYSDIDGGIVLIGHWKEHLLDLP